MKTGHSFIDEPRGAVAHLENIHVDDGSHTSVSCMCGCFDGVDTSGAAEDVGPCVDVDVDCSIEQFFTELEGSTSG